MVFLMTNQFVELVGRQAATDLRQIHTRLRDRASGVTTLRRCGNIAELRRLARRRVPKAVFDFVDGAAEDERTAARNREGFGRLALWPRALVDVSEVDLATTVLGEPVAVPLVGAPTGLTGLLHERGEVAVARAVHAAGSVYIASAMASYSIEELSRLAPGPTWFQLYVWRDRGLVRELVQRAGAANHLALVLTIDVPRAGARERDRRNGFGIPPRLTLRSAAEGLLRPRWSAAFVRRPRMAVANAAGHDGAPNDAVSLTDYINSQFDPTLSWHDVAWLREQWTGPLVVKGILRPEDARDAVSAGAEAVVVSNHGGRQLAQTTSAIGALPAVVDAVGADAEVYVDGGIRRGADVAAALALGARACLAGRALLYGLGAGGDEGAARAMDILVEELRRTLELAGCRSVRELDRSWVVDAATTQAIPAAQYFDH